MAEVVAGQYEDEDEAMVPAVYKHEDRELIVLAVNMHDRLVAFLKGHEQFETDVAAANDFNYEPASLPPPLYDDLLGMRRMRDELLKEARGDK